MTMPVAATMHKLACLLHNCVLQVTKVHVGTNYEGMEHLHTQLTTAPGFSMLTST